MSCVSRCWNTAQGDADDAIIYMVAYMTLQCMGLCGHVTSPHEAIGDRAPRRKSTAPNRGMRGNHDTGMRRNRDVHSIVELTHRKKVQATGTFSRRRNLSKKLLKKNAYVHVARGSRGRSQPFFDAAPLGAKNVPRKCCRKIGQHSQWQP